MYIITLPSKYCIYELLRTMGNIHPSMKKILNNGYGKYITVKKYRQINIDFENKEDMIAFKLEYL